MRRESVERLRITVAEISNRISETSMRVYDDYTKRITLRYGHFFHQKKNTERTEREIEYSRENDS